MITVFHAWPYGRFIDIQSNLSSKKLHRTNQGSNFLGGSFTSGDYFRAQNQFRRESQQQYLKGWFFLKNRPIQFHINRIQDSHSTKFERMPQIYVKLSFRELCNSKLSGLHLFDNMAIIHWVKNRWKTEM